MPNIETHEVLTTVDERLDRLEERRNRNISEKMDAWERLFNVIIDTKITTVTELLTRLQQEKNDQYNENRKKVEKCNADIMDIRAKLSEMQIKYDALSGDTNVVKGVTREIERNMQGQTQKVVEFVEWRTRTDIEKERMSESINSMSETLAEISKWRDTFWYKYLASGIVIVLAATEFLAKVWEWIKAALSQQGG